jgi:SlyX protein
MTDGDRITELEIRLAYQEDLLQALNNAICEQQAQIDRLHTVCRVLGERLKNLAEPTTQTMPGHEKPPHY